VTARVANLAGMEMRGASEREVLQRIVAAFKSHVAARYEAKQPIEWIEPLAPPGAAEQTRLIAVHL
jgi:hypothetical protein